MSGSCISDLKEAILTKVKTAELLLFCGSISLEASNGCVFGLSNHNFRGGYWEIKLRRERGERKSDRLGRKMILSEIHSLYIFHTKVNDS